MRVDVHRSKIRVDSQLRVDGWTAKYGNAMARGINREDALRRLVKQVANTEADE